jgi:secondary thiamine-phosphate synthase enzyme
MRIDQERLEIRTNGKGLYEITDEIQSKIDKCGVRNGTVTVFVQHTSCSVIIMENADPTARRDLEEFFDRLIPEDADYFTHGSEGSDDMPSHIRMVLTRTSETVPIMEGKMQLGTWQGIFLFEHRRAWHRRRFDHHYRRIGRAIDLNRLGVRGKRPYR